MIDALRKELVESLKEGARVFLLAVIPLLVVQLESGVFDWRALAVAGAIAILRFVDKLLHKANPVNRDGWLGRKGLTGF